MRIARNRGQGSRDRGKPKGFYSCSEGSAKRRRRKQKGVKALQKPWERCQAA